MIVREMNRRCNYNRELIQQTYDLLANYCWGHEVSCRKQWVSINIINQLGSEKLDMNTLCKLRDLCREILKWNSSSLLCIHDSFLASPNNMNKVRYWYKEILAELADSNTLQDILTELYGEPVKVNKQCSDLSDYIRQSNYAIC